VSQAANTGQRKRVLSGMRPTGRLHIGHYFGALKNWIRMQEEYDCFYFVADWHALTTHYEETSSIAENTLQVAIDWLAAGLDPAKSTIFVQSSVLEHAELHVLLSMITPLSWLERVPTYKEQIENLKDRDLGTYGFLGYPLLQSADIVIYDADFVPVGEDQVPHVELTREIVRTFNFTFGLRIQDDLFRDPQIYNRVRSKFSGSFREPAGTAPAIGNQSAELAGNSRMPEFRIAARRAIDEWGFENFLQKMGRDAKYFKLKPILYEPAHLLTETPRLPGTDGRRMAKSYGNAIWLSESDDSMRRKIRGMVTDPARVRRHDPGNPDVCPVFAWHKLFSDQPVIDRVNKECRTAEIGCVDCKGMMADALIRWISPVRARRLEFEAQPEKVRDILAEGSAKARKAARRTMGRVRKAIFGEQGAAKREPAAAKVSGAGN